MGPGVDRTRIEPRINRSGLELSGLIEQTERRGDQLLVITYTTHPGSLELGSLEPS